MGDHRHVLSFATAALLLIAGPAAAGCTRTIVVPGALQGRLVMVDGTVVRGVFPDLLRELGATVGCEFVFPQLPRARAERDFFNDHVGDVFFPAVRRPERDSGNVFLSVGRQPLAVFAPREVTIPERLSQLMADTRLRGVFMRGIWLGDTYGRTLETLATQGRLDLVSDYAAMVRMLKAGRASFTLMPYANATAGPLGEPTGLLSKDDAFMATLLRDGPEVDIGIYLSRRNLVSADLELIESMITRARRDGTMRRIYLRYYPEAAVKTIQF